MSPLKKSLRASEQQRPDVARARRRWMREQSMFDPARLVFMVLAEVMVEFREMAKEQAEAARAGDKEAQQKRVYYQGTLETDKANYRALARWAGDGVWSTNEGCPSVSPIPPLRQIDRLAAIWRL